MRRQRNTQQMKKQGKNPPDQTNEEEIGSLPEKEFRVMIVKMIQNLGNRMEKGRERPNKNPEIRALFQKCLGEFLATGILNCEF